MSITTLARVEMGRWGETSRGLWRGRDVVMDIYSCRAGGTLAEVFWSHGLGGNDLPV